jgi:UDP-N-acetylglucosamine:LPS N-acetylglucosamine transferase
MHFVMYDSAPADARLPGFERSMPVGGLPVREGFGCYGRSDARTALGVAQDDFVVLVTGGAWGLGNIRTGVEALVGLEPPVRVLAVCGNNAHLEADLRRVAGGHPGRLDVHGFVRNMPELMAAADVVVTNGAGVTVLEALRTPRPVIAFAPLAGHGTASTAEMVRRNLAVEARDINKLVEQIRRLRKEPALARKMEQAGQRWLTGRSLAQSVAEIEDAYLQHAGGRRLPKANGLVHIGVRLGQTDQSAPARLTS